MKTDFTPEQMAEPGIEIANAILRKCVHCGFCTATCPTYVLLGDELDSPRGRIFMIRDMLEKDEVPSARVVKHVDRCLSCLSCMTTCPASVDYMHLVDEARARIERRFKRPMADRWLRGLLAYLVPRPALFRLALSGGRLARPLAGLLPGRLGGLIGLAPKRPAPAAPTDRPQVFRAIGERRLRVALMPGCAQRALRPAIDEATVRLLTRLGCEVVIAEGSACCGAITHHMGREETALVSAKANIEAWERAAADGGIDAVVSNASGCGVVVKDYGHMLRDDAAWAERARAISDKCRDVSEIVDDLGADGRVPSDAPVVAYHCPCSMQHGLKLKAVSPELLRAAGFEVREPNEAHICCGSAGTYNILQPVLAGQLGERKADNLERLGAAVVATGNIGCLVHLDKALGGKLPVVHTVELLDWAGGGPKPRGVP